MERAGIINLLLFLLIVVVAWFGVWSFWQKTSGLRVSIDALGVSLEEEKAAVQKLAELERLTTERATEIAKLEIAVPAQRDIASLIAAFEEAASTNGLALASLGIFEAEAESGRVFSDSEELPVGEGIGPAPFKTVSAQIKLSGRYPAFRSFLADLEKSFPLVEPVDISFQLPAESEVAGGTVPVDPVLDITLTLEGYYLKD